MRSRSDEHGRDFCADTSRQNAEPLAATASVADHWILIEYRGVWAHDALAASALAPEVKRHLRRRARELGRAKVLFIRRTERRRAPGFHVFWGSCAERGAWLRGAQLDRHEQLLELDFVDGGDPVPSPLLLVCTHGKHDPCCARYGRPLYQAIAEQVDESWAWQCSHVGGDRFAANLVILPEGLYFGRLDPAAAWTVLDEYLGGRIHLPAYRGRACHSFAVQAAERAVREETGRAGLDEVQLISTRPIAFRAGGRTYEVEVERALGSLTHLTCSAPELRHPRHYVARSLRESGA
jgi:hypothetical protein